MAVQDLPRSRSRHTLGEGLVIELRRLGNRDQVLVEFPRIGERVWLPFENLRGIKGPEARFLGGQFGEHSAAERFRLRCLAIALRMWNENTGSLSHLDIDPLPHQIYLVHHILASGNLNWLIADDVGLGKTIEVGMLMSALIQRKLARRILVVSPAGLVKQWQDELHNKFKLSEFEIYGVDFQVNQQRQWRTHNHVIGSIDRLKAPEHLESLRRAGNWDLIVFDEAHWLSRRRWGSKVEAAQRFRLAANLRGFSDAFILLTGTPHQGKTDKFQALLELLRPELKREIQEVEVQPRILRKMVIRNHKADVTDSDGRLVFRGKVIRAIRIPLGKADEAFDRSLRRYLREGYEAGRKLGQQGRAIGFTMTTYRKLAASSICAIHDSLVRRRERLLAAGEELLAGVQESAVRDERFLGEWEEHHNPSAREFFSGELDMLDDLIIEAKVLLQDDPKLHAFLNEIVQPILQSNSREKLVIFSEYRSTQRYLHDALERVYGDGSVKLINGSMNWEERAQAIREFEDTGSFLISTEAGGEGVNLHHRCHIMVNFDLPWNPMRLVQRVGRLYRYGQERTVVVLNVHSPQTLDSHIVDLLYDRIDQIVKDLAPLGGEFKEGLQDEILGELAELVDIEDILEDAHRVGQARTAERLDEALAEAQKALEKQRELFEYAAGFDPKEMAGELALSREHVKGFVSAMLGVLGIELREVTHQGEVFDLRLPEDVKEALPGYLRRLRVVFDRKLARTRTDWEMMDFGSPFLRYLLDQAEAHSFGGLVADVANLPLRGIVATILRWQNDQGFRMRQEFAAIGLDGAGAAELNPEAFAEWLLHPASAGDSQGDRDAAKACLNACKTAAEVRLSEVSNADLHPENLEVVGAAWGDGSSDWIEDRAGTGVEPE
jgi:superfamily II DNA or RNA helicase